MTLRPRAGAACMQVVKLDNAVAVVADRFWRAKEALALLKPEWDTGAAGKTDSAQFAKLYRDTLDGPMVSARNDGNVDAEFVVRRFERQDRRRDLRGAASCACHHGAAQRHGAICEATSSTSGSARKRRWARIRQAAAASGLKPEQINIHNCFLGGGFGRRSINDEMRQAILVAKQVGRPVKLVWTREEDVTQDRYRPQAAVRMKAALGPNGMPTAFDAKIAVGSILRSTGINKVESGVEAPGRRRLRQHSLCDPKPARRLHAQEHPCAGDVLAFGRLLAERVLRRELYRRVGACGGAGRATNSAARCSSARSDFLGVLDKIAEKSDWGKPLPAGRGRGIAIHECYGSIIGQVAEVTVSKKGEVRVDRVVAAVDCGHVVNPGIVEAQIQSGVIYGLSAALYGEITIKDGRVEQSNFDNYQVVTLADTPKIEVYLALSGGTKWGGIGEPGTAADRAGGRQRGVRRHRHARALAAAQECEAGGAIVAVNSHGRACPAIPTRDAQCRPSGITGPSPAMTTFRLCKVTSRFASSIACQIRAGVIGISRCRMP